MIEADAQINIVPGIYNSYKTGDIVFIGFEENKMESPVVLGKLFISASTEASSYRGSVSGNSLAITDTALLPYSTVFNYDKIAQNSAIYKDLNTPKKLADGILNLQRSQIHRYQTIIRVSVNDIKYDLYIKTTNDFTYSLNKSDEPLFRLCTALKNSQTADTFIPIELAIAENTTISQALIQVQEMTPTDFKLKVLIGETFHTITKTSIVSVQSLAIYY
jgi:hypothetical protein